MFFQRISMSVKLNRNISEISYKKIKYLALKRGILENELIFEKFFDAKFDKLTTDEVSLFSEFLEEYDWDVFAWITGQKIAPEKYKSSNLLKMIRECIFLK